MNREPPTPDEVQAVEAALEEWERNCTIAAQAAEDIWHNFTQAWEEMEDWIIECYLVFEDHGLVEPLYDPEVLGDEMEVFV